MAEAKHASDPSYVLALAIVFMILCPIFTTLRFYTRTKVNKDAYVGADDWLMIPATLLTVGCGIVLIFGTSVKVFGYTISDFDLDFRYCQQLQWAFLLMHIPSIGCIKLSFVLFFRRIFCVSRWRTPFEIISAVVAVLVVLWNIAFFFWFLFSCGTHFTARWTSTETYLQYCGTDDISDLGLSISDFLTDILVLALPIPMVWKPHMNIKKKFLVLAIFALGLVALIVSTIRMVFFVYVISATNGGNVGILGIGAIIAPGADNNLLTTETLYWSMLEQGLALVACCLPTLNGLFHQRTVQSIIKSVRSFQSLNLRRNSSRGQLNESDEFRDQSGIPMGNKTSVSYSARKGSMATENSDKRGAGSVPGPEPKLAIRVDHTIEQTSGAV